MRATRTVLSCDWRDCPAEYSEGAGAPGGALASGWVIGVMAEAPWYDSLRRQGIFAADLCPQHAEGVGAIRR